MSDHIRQSPIRYGHTLRQCSGSPPDIDCVNEVAQKLNRHPYITDADGFDCDILAAAIDQETGRFAYVEQCARKGTTGVDITIKIHHGDQSCDIKSYNPFFGCDVRYFQWHGSNAVMVYREKRDTYACRFGAAWPPQFHVIADRWLITDDRLTFLGRNDSVVSSRTIPSLAAGEPLLVTDAAAQNLLPEELDAFLD